MRRETPSVIRYSSSAHKNFRRSPRFRFYFSKRSERSNFLPPSSRPNRGTRESAGRSVPRPEDPRLRTLVGDHRDPGTRNSTRTGSSLSFLLSPAGLSRSLPNAKIPESTTSILDRERETSSRRMRSPRRAETRFRAGALELPNYADGLLTPLHSFVVRNPFPVKFAGRASSRESTRRRRRRSNKNRCRVRKKRGRHGGGGRG